MARSDLFISHASLDSDAAAALVAEIENAGVACWFAPRDVSLGGSYQAEIVDAIENCRAVLLVFSEAANKSEHVLREIELAARDKKPIYPVKIDRSEPTGGLKYLLANKQWVERTAVGNRLADRIAKLFASPGSEIVRDDSKSPVTPPAKSRAPTIAICAALVVVIAVAAMGWFFGRGLFSEPAVTARGPDHKADASKLVSSNALPSSTGVDSSSQDRPNTPATPTSVPKQSSPKPALVLASLPPQSSEVGTGGQLFRECDVCPIMAVIPPGQASVGSPNHEPGRNASEGPQQVVMFTHAFAAGQTEVTFDEWLACVAEGGCNAHRPGDYGWGHGKQPVINVSWNDAKSYVEWLSRKTGKPYRLLSEAEWEYAARGCLAACGSKTFWFGNDIAPARANYDWRFSYNASPKAQPPRRTIASDSSEPNPFGLYHVHGNVREWVEDCWNASLTGLPKDGAARSTGDCESRVVRGGSWSDEPKELRAAARSWEVKGERRAQIGFRVGRSLTP